MDAPQESVTPDTDISGVPPRAPAGWDPDIASASPSLGPLEVDITIAYEGSKEYYPHVSSCGDGATGLYLVVYEENHDIRGQKLTRAGAKTGSEFTIFDGTSDTDYYFDPDVSCDVFRNRFIVVASHDAPTYHAVEAIAVKGTSSPGSEVLSSELTVSSSLSVRHNDSVIACDGDNKACLVVWVMENTTSDDIKAQRLSDISSAPYIQELGDEITISDYSTDENSPDVAWEAITIATWSPGTIIVLPTQVIRSFTAT